MTRPASPSPRPWSGTTSAIACDTTRGGSLRFTRDPAPAPIAEPSNADARWRAMLAASPKLHDAPIWSVRSLATGPGQHEVVAALTPETYRQLALQSPGTAGTDAIELGVRLLGAKAIIVAEGTGSAGPCVLLARRSPHTRVYGGQWEVAPGGGVDRPAPSATGPVPTPADTVLALVQELADELGHDWSRSIGAAAVVGLIDDPVARSVDVVVRAQWRTPVAPWSTALDPVLRRAGGRWEVSEAFWLALRDAPQWLAEQQGAVSPPTLAALALPGLIG